MHAEAYEGVAERVGIDTEPDVGMGGMVRADDHGRRYTAGRIGLCARLCASVVLALLGACTLAVVEVELE